MQIGHHNLDERVMIVADAGNNHEGSFARAEEFIGRALDAGADAIKFQTIIPEKLIAANETARLAQLERLSLGAEQFIKLAEIAKSAGITFLSTPFDLDSVATLEPHVPAYKIASGDNDFVQLLECVAETGKPILLSTGMLDLDGVIRAKQTIESVWRNKEINPGLALLHCVVAYPTPPEEANLRAIQTLATLNVTVGYSDHTLGLEACPAAVALGARVVEKHFTLDKGFSTYRDHQLSADPEEFAQMVKQIRVTEAMLGTGVKRTMIAEQSSLLSARRSIMAAHDLPSGAIIAKADLTYLRPRVGMAPADEAKLIGRRLSTSVRRGEPILLEHLAQ